MLLPVILAIVFLFLSLLHLSWCVGSTWGFDDAIPTNVKGERMINPGKFDSLIVGIGLLFFSAFYLIKAGLLPLELPAIVLQVAGWLIPCIFMFRAIGDFKYVGFSKKVTSTAFARKDSRYYSPLCLFIATIGYLIQLV